MHRKTRQYFVNIQRLVLGENDTLALEEEEREAVLEKYTSKKNKNDFICFSSHFVLLFIRVFGEIPKAPLPVVHDKRCSEALERLMPFASHANCVLFFQSLQGK